MDITDIQELTHQTPTDLMGGVVAMAGLRTINRSPAMVVQADTAPTRGMTSRLAAPVMVGMVAIGYCGRRRGKRGRRRMGIDRPARTDGNICRR